MSDSTSSNSTRHFSQNVSLRALCWAALGVVFGDVGTSPLYAMSETVSSHLMATHGIKEKVTMRFGQFYGADEVLGWTSLFLWAIALVVTVKYVMLILRADNHGEGGMFSILALLQEKASHLFSARGLAVAVAMAVIGSALVLGDGVITPSLSILSAWEGLEVVTDRWSPYIPMLSIATLVVLFSVQRFGTARVGAVFAPAMALWFAVLAVMGIWNLMQHPEVLRALNPLYAARYLFQFPRAALFVIGSVDLCITGCEALFADMGHFGRPAIRRIWLSFVWPALALNYLGQGARLLDASPVVEGNVFYALVPSHPAFVYPLVVLSWCATVIASQALISGAFSLVHQAIQLGFFPRSTVVHTNASVEGQIYIPVVNWGYLLLCISLVLFFPSSHNLAPAYGLAVTGTMAMTTMLFYLVATKVWRWRRMAIAPLCGLLLCVDFAFFASNATQFFEGGFVTVLIAAAVAVLMFTWRKGRVALSKTMTNAALPVDELMRVLDRESPIRVPGTAVFMTGNPGAPPALVHYLRHARTLHRTVILLSVQTKHVPEIVESERISALVSHGGGVWSAVLCYGFVESPDVPQALAALREKGIELSEVSYFLGRESLLCSGHSGMTLIRKVLFRFLSRNAVAASTFFKLPPEQVVELGMQVQI